VLVLRDGQHLSFGQSAEGNAIFECYHGFSLGPAICRHCEGAPIFERFSIFHKAQPVALI
jgi:hypothetical protein